MKLGNINDIKRGLASRFGHVYLDDNEVVTMDRSDPRSVAYLHVGRPGYIWVYPADKSQPFEIAVEGAARETCDAPLGWTHAG